MFMGVVPLTILGLIVPLPSRSRGGLSPVTETKSCHTRYKSAMYSVKLGETRKCGSVVWYAMVGKDQFRNRSASSRRHPHRYHHPAHKPLSRQRKSTTASPTLQILFGGSKRTMWIPRGRHSRKRLPPRSLGQSRISRPARICQTGHAPSGRWRAVGD